MRDAQSNTYCDTQSDVHSVAWNGAHMTGVLRQWRRRVFIVRMLRGDARAWVLRRYFESAQQRAARLAAATLGKHGRIVFVCHGNIMRSAYATQVARAYAPHAATRIVGAGTHAVPGRPAQDTAIQVSRELTPSLHDHTATPLSHVQLGAHDVVVCMDAMNEGNVLAAHPTLAPRVFRVGDICDMCDINARSVIHRALRDREIHDPYGRGVDATRAAFDQVALLARAWVERLLIH